MKYSYSFDGEVYYGSFDTVEEALAECRREFPERKGRRVWIGENVAPPPPEDFWHVADWLECVVCQDEYSGDWAEGWDTSTKEQMAELEKDVRAVMRRWLKRYDLTPKFFNIANPREYTEAGVQAE